MKPKASLKFLKVKVRQMASRPATSDQPESARKAVLRASTDNRSVISNLLLGRHLVRHRHVNPAAHPELYGPRTDRGRREPPESASRQALARPACRQRRFPARVPSFGHPVTMT